MPSLLHEAPRLLLEERPELLFELLGTPIPEGARVALASADLTQGAMPASPETLARVQEAIDNLRFVRGLIFALKDVMAERGIPFTDLGRASLDRCEDAEKVRACIRRAVTASTEADIFGDEPPPS